MEIHYWRSFRLGSYLFVVYLINFPSHFPRKIRNSNSNNAELYVCKCLMDKQKWWIYRSNKRKLRAWIMKMYRGLSETVLCICILILVFTVYIPLVRFIHFKNHTHIHIQCTSKNPHTFLFSFRLLWKFSNEFLRSFKFLW